MKRLTKSQKLQTEVIDVVHGISSSLLQVRVVGLRKEDAEKLTLEEQKKFRITREDDTYHVCGVDYDTTRLNVEIQKGIVTRASIG